MAGLINLNASPKIKSTKILANDLDSHVNFHVEVLQQSQSVLPKKKVAALVTKYLSTIPSKQEKVYTEFDDPELQEHIQSISVCDIRSTEDSGLGDVPAKVFYHVYCFNSSGPNLQDDSEEDIQVSTQWMLPTTEFYGLWESLIYDLKIKDELLNYVSTALTFSEKNVDANIISWNKVVLLHGPPGTGKTSLCKALAQKLCIRFSDKYSHGVLLEINTHSLFSKWFSESGKLVTKMFQSIQQLLEDQNALTMILIDEVESLAHSRKAAMNGTEPSDSIRVVNALLTQLDLIKRYPNVLILTTSNMTEAIDLALVDRADIKQYIGYPSVEAIYQIYYTCICELQKVGIVNCKDKLLNSQRLKEFNEIKIAIDELNNAKKLSSIATKSQGMSGRSLRKMPFIALSLFTVDGIVKLEIFLEALSKAVDKYFNDVDLLSDKKPNAAESQQLL